LQHFVAKQLAKQKRFSYDCASMNEQLALQNLLRERFGEIRATNPAFSLRAFAKKLGLDSGALCSFMNGKRRVSRKMAGKISDAMGFDPQERAEILSGFKENTLATQPISGEPLRYLQLTADQFRIIAKWHHFAILSLMETKGFRSNPEWIANRLGLTKTQVQDALGRLKRLGMISVDASGKIRQGKSKYRTPDDVTNLSLRQGHAENLELGKQSLVRGSVDQRDFTAVTMAIDPNKLPDAKVLIRKFQDDLAALLESGQQTEVYKLCVQLFPLTVLDERKPS
jgi:uncharacterized protein (TIGR02147 family)